MKRRDSGPLFKAYIVPPMFRQALNHGSSVPAHEHRLMADLVQKRPPEFNAMTLLDHTEPRYSAEDIVKGLFGADAALESSWSRFLKKELVNACNVLEFRKSLFAKMQQDRLPAELRRALSQRSLSAWAELRKSVVEVITPDALLKAERGGKYVRKVKTASGARYFYDEEKYNRSKYKQVSGPEARKAYLSKTIYSMVTKAGSGGCELASMKALAKKYGAAEVGSVLKSSCQSGALRYAKGRFYAQGN